MNQTDQSNHYFQMAVQYVNNTAQNIFLTGKAGTGKTTFLKYIKENTYKKLAVVAPTGVAAINAGGVTIHSFFQLPFGPFLPTREKTSEYSLKGISNQQSLFNQMHLNSSKRTLMQELELLIIDEVSMVRADLLDAIDTVLRHIRREPQLPFGGVQVLFIGDLFQLPPVVNDHEWKTLGQYYNSPFFFDAHALKQTPPLYLELKKIYRQSDVAFINVLNNIRNNKMQEEDLKLLHEYYRPGFQPPAKGEYITLTTHNSKADTINQNELKKLPGKPHTFKATIEGDFNEKSSPAENILQLKEGAQIIFIKNDKGEDRRYYNGKIGTIKRITGEEIYVSFPNETDEMLVEKETWRNIRYKYDNDSDNINEEMLGTFTQYPIRLAWAITIHKSQGLTFTKAIIDAGDSFAAGQVYVALSRLTSLDGLVLLSRIESHCISTDNRMTTFAQTEPESDALQQKLKEMQKEFIANTLLLAFDWNKLINSAQTFLQEFDRRQIPHLKEAKIFADEILQKTMKQKTTAVKFTGELEKMLPAAEQAGFKQVHERIEAASRYFCDTLYKEQFIPLQQHFDKMKNESRVKKYLKELYEMNFLFKRKKVQLEQAVLLIAGLKEGTDMNALLEKIVSERKSVQVQEEMKPPFKKAKQPKGESHRISLKLFKSGKSVMQIAEERGMTIGTIEGHLISFIPTGELKIKEFISESKIEIILKVLEETEEVNSSAAIKEKLGDEYSYNEIRAVMSYNKVVKV